MTALQNRKVMRGRHPRLKHGTLSFQIFQHLKINGACTLKGLASAVKHSVATVNGSIQRMKKDGLIRNAPEQHGNRVINKYAAVIENETGTWRDRIELETTIFVNKFGEYSAVSVVVGQLMTAFDDDPKPVHRHKHYIVVPKPSEPYSTRQIFDKDFKGGREPAKNQQGLIIEGEAVHIEK